jgi:DNA-dependent RNA polymerase auxiliary subunit epsilon
MTSAFKSTVPKTTIYAAEEKRIRELYGEKKNNIKFKIKLNDEILEREKRSSTVNSGKLIKG